MGLGGVSATPLRLKETEAFLRNRKAINGAVIVQAQEIAGGEISPIDDLRSTAHYRSTVALNLLAEFLAAVR
jgi:xanthine dehydrogenase iron-sulfur cluster and FAD-binding subunit A